MPEPPPPPYDKAVSQPPNLNVTAPSGAISAPNTGGGNQLARQRSNASTVSSVSDEDGAEKLAPGMTEDGRRSMDDEQRELPSGWVRCFDPKQEHHFYVDTATERSIWIHPYDDPEYLQSLPDTHPANPNSKEGRAVAEQAKREEAERAKAQKEGRNWFQKKKDDLIGTKEERKKAKEEKAKKRRDEYQRSIMAQQAYIKRREELMRQQLNNPSIHSRYASNPFGYAAPMSPYSRMGMGGMGGMSGMGGMGYSPYGYGYGGGYGRRYGGGMGMGMPLLGGMAGGMLLGSAMSGGFGGYGGYGDGYGGGGDYGGGGGDMGGGGGDGGGGGGE